MEWSGVEWWEDAIRPPRHRGETCSRRIPRPDCHSPLLLCHFRGEQRLRTSAAISADGASRDMPHPAPPVRPRLQRDAKEKRECGELSARVAGHRVAGRWGGMRWMQERRAKSSRRRHLWFDPIRLRRMPCPEPSPRAAGPARNSLARSRGGGVIAASRRYLR